MKGIRRGDVVIAFFPREFGKPRPGVVIQNDMLNAAGYPSVVLCPFSTTIRDDLFFRVTIEPRKENGLHERSQIMTDKPLTLSLERVKERIGRLSAAEMEDVNREVAFILGLVVS